MKKKSSKKGILLFLCVQIFVIIICHFCLAETFEELKKTYVTRDEWKSWYEGFNMNFKEIDYAISQKLYNEIRYEYWIRGLEDKTDPVVFDKQLQQYEMKRQATINGEANNIYSVTFVTNGGMWKTGKQPLMYRKGNEETLLPTSADIHNSGKVFEGWYDNISFDGDVVTTVRSDRKRPTIYFAKWRNLNPGETEEDYSSQYRINYFLNGGSWYNFTPTVYRRPLTAVTLPNSSQIKLAGNEFLGWFETPDFSTPQITSIQASCDTDKTFYAKWQEATYNINYHYDGTLSGFTLKNTRLYHESVPLPTSAHITRNNYVFVGWYANNSYTGTKYTSIPANTIGNMDLYLKWAKEKYSITLVENGGSYVSGYTEPTERSYLTSFTLPTNDNIKYTGKTLIGWYDNPSLTGSPIYTISANVEGDKTYFAKWEEAVYTMNYHLDHGSTSASLPSSRKYSQSVTLPNNDQMSPSSGYKFRGWFADASHTTLITSVAANSTTTDVYAGFEPMNNWGTKGSDGNWNGVPYSSWMSKIPDDMYLSEINIPGAHDCGCKNVSAQGTITSIIPSWTDDFAKTQSYCIVGSNTQLEQGVRALDIRLDNNNRLCHGDESVEIDLGLFSVDVNMKYLCKDDSGNNITLDNVFNKASEFLHNHSTETIIMLITNESGSGTVAKAKATTEACISKYVAGYNGRSNYKGIYSGTTIPKLGDVRGKIVILSDGLGLSNCINYKNMDKDGDTLDSVKFVVENHYEETKSNKWNYVETALNKCTTKINTQINKASKTPNSANIWTTSNCAGDLDSNNTPTKIDDYIDPKRRGYGWVQGNAYGLIWMDFVRQADTNYVIASNP